MSSRASPTLWQADPDILATDLGDELVLLHATSGQLYRLNPVARTIWLRLPTSEAAMLEAVLEGFEVDRETARTGVERLLTDLEALSMARRA